MRALPRLTGTRDLDFPQPAHFLRLTDIASVFNNRLQNRKTIFSMRWRTGGRAMRFRGCAAKIHNHNQSTGPEIRQP
ncbi:hypothetical protein D1006_11980 [Burkholderia stabilis]|uniref:Uncharacterized protein n=1 Tax=Burkholderia stabilis TaxID=95485 RepID=A0A4Q2ASE7_9BURK|nr:hypothetical protein D1006_11980 [Burkholderia stabilis]